jgi:hypothetical protein
MPIGKKEATQRGKTASPLFPATVLTTVTENREQEVMLSSPLSLAPSRIEQSRCHWVEALIPVTRLSVLEDFLIGSGVFTS